MEWSKDNEFNAKRSQEEELELIEKMGGVEVIEAIYENKDTNENKSKNYIDPYSVQMMIYKAEMYVLLRYPHLTDINKKNEDVNKTLSDKARFFIIKSFHEEDVHKAIKYNIWSSSKHGNKYLNEQYKQSGEIYLFFLSKNSKLFLGVAKMTSEVDFDKSFPLWTREQKWPGLFSLEWVLIKDVPFYPFKEIRIEMTDGVTRPVIFARDTQEISDKEGRIMLEKIANFSNKNTLLEHFEHYDMRQENYERINPIQY